MPIKYNYMNLLIIKITFYDKYGHIFANDALKTF